jgi:carbamoyl-phosphate synthase small subunit
MTRHGILALADGTVLEGVAIGASGLAVGEVVFNTAMTGYQEILTDPSYHQQIVTLTGAHVGNTGVNGQDLESPAPMVAGLLVHDVPRLHASWRATMTLGEYLTRHGIVALGGVNTRRLTHLLRDGGAQNGAILVPGEGQTPDREAAISAARSFAGLGGADLAKVVTAPEPFPWTEGRVRWSADMPEARATAEAARPHVVAYDFGIKREILRLLVDRGCRVTVVPAETPAARALALRPDGVFLSNGPGDPAPVTYAQEAIRAFVAADLPIFGICLGHQLLCLALGARSLKMKFGHHGANHPVKELGGDRPRVFITSQNHGFAIDADSLPPTLRPSHVSLFDGSLQGVSHVTKPIFSFQGHPEASPGPRDIEGLFDRFAAHVHARTATRTAQPR